MDRGPESDPTPNGSAVFPTEKLKPAPSRRLANWLLACLLVAALFLVYRPAWRGGMLWDDAAHVPSTTLQSLDGLRRIWLELKATPQYYPVVYSVFWVEHRLWGKATLGYHLVNIAIHAATALLLFRVLRRLHIPGAHLATALFALHPVQVESVAWMTELKNTLSAVFYLGAILCYLRFDQSRAEWANSAASGAASGRRPWRTGNFVAYALALGLFTLALLSKTVTATLPAGILVIMWWRRGRLEWKRDVAPLVPMFVLALAFGLLSAWMEQREVDGTPQGTSALMPVERCLVAGRAAWFYAGKLVWPEELVFIYPRWDVRQDVWWQYVFPLTAAGALALCWLIRRRSRAPLAAALFFGGTLFPALGFLNIYPFQFSYVADHFQYLACLGPLVLMSAGVATALRDKGRAWRTAGRLAGGIVLCVLAMLSWQQSKIYADSQTLYHAVIAHNPRCWMAHNNMGVELSNAGQLDEAMNHWREALRIRPDYTRAMNNLGQTLVAMGRVAEGIAWYQSALRVQPDYVEARNNLGLVLFIAGRVAEAIQHWSQALQVNPRNADVHNNLANAMCTSGLFNEAIGHYEQAIASRPDFAEAHNNLANVLCQSGRTREGIEHYRAALRVSPDYLDALNNLSSVLLGQGRADEVIAQCKQSLHYAEAAGHSAKVNAIRARLEQCRWGSPRLR